MQNKERLISYETQFIDIEHEFKRIVPIYYIVKMEFKIWRQERTLHTYLSARCFINELLVLRVPAFKFEENFDHFILRLQTQILEKFSLRVLETYFDVKTRHTNKQEMLQHGRAEK